jgi:hypothetical protein
VLHLPHPPTPTLSPRTPRSARAVGYRSVALDEEDELNMDEAMMTSSGVILIDTTVCFTQALVAPAPVHAPITRMSATHVPAPHSSSHSIPAMADGAKGSSRVVGDFTGPVDLALRIDPPRLSRTAVLDLIAAAARRTSSISLTHPPPLSPHPPHARHVQLGTARWLWTR